MPLLRQVLRHITLRYADELRDDVLRQIHYMMSSY